MSLATLAATDLEAFAFHSDGFAETVTYAPGGGAPAVSVASLWRPVRFNQMGPGGISDRAEVYVPAGQLLDAAGDALTPQVGRMLTRYPGESYAETWRLDDLARAGTAWKLAVVKNQRPVPR